MNKRISRLKGLITTSRALIRRIEREGSSSAKHQLEGVKSRLAQYEAELKRAEESNKYLFTIYVGNGL
jgi:hypothetical protein